MRFRRNALWIGALAALAALSVVGCSGGGFSERAESKAGNVFRYPIPTNPTSLDPHIVQDGDTLDLLQNVYEGLVGWNEQNEVTGLLAESWTLSEDGKTYTFKLRPGVKFHNGREVTADDVKWSFERACNPELKSTTADAYLSDIVGVTDRVNGKATEVAGVRVVDAQTVAITLKQPTPYFLGKLTYLVSAVIPKESVPAATEINQLENVVGTGPYRLTDYQDKQIAVLSANAEYWGGAPKLEKIERPVILDSETRLTKFRNNEVDLVQLERPQAEGMMKDPALKDQVKAFPRPAIWYVGMNTQTYAPFKDRRVRQAVAMAIDRDRIVDTLLNGMVTKAETIVPPGVFGHRPTGKGLAFNVEEAKRLMAEAGHANGQGLPTLTLTHREGRVDIKLVAEAVATMLKQNLNMPVEVRAMEWRAYLEDYNNSKHQIYHMRWAADFLDAQNFLSHMLTTNGPENRMGYSNPEYDRLCAAADRELDPEKRKALYAQAEDIVLQDAIWVPLFYQRDLELHAPGLSGMRESLFGHLPHTTTTIRRER